MRRTLFLTAAVPLLVLVGGGVAAAAPTTDPDPERIRQFTECLREHGVDLPDPTQADGPVRIEIGPDERAAFEGALEACEPFAPGPGRSVEVDPALRAQFEEFHRCLEDNGVDVPEVPEEGAGLVVRAERGADGPPPGVPADGRPHVVVGGTAGPVPEACRDLLPAPPVGGPVVVGRDEVVAGAAAAGGVGDVVIEVHGPHGGGE